MLTVTENASDHLVQILDQAKAPKEAAVRVEANERGLQMRIDVAKPGDKVIDRDGKHLLLVEDRLAEQLGERTLDVKETPTGPALTLV